MRVTVACAGCRLKKIKCIHNGCAPCQNCQTRNGRDECRLFTTQEFRKYKRANTVLLKIDSGKMELSESLVNTCIEITVQNHPELVFLYFPANINLFRLLDPVVCLGLCALSSPFLDKSPANSEFVAAFETKLLQKLDDRVSMDYLVLLQASVIWLLLSWQTGKTNKGYLFGGFADRVYTSLTKQKNTSGSLIEQEFYIRSIWAYQLTCLSLREGYTDGRARLTRYRLPMPNKDLLFGHMGPAKYLGDINLSQTSELVYLFVYTTDIWTDCNTWIFKGGRNHYREAPWDPASKWHSLHMRIESLEAQLGPKEKFSLSNLEAHFSLGEGTIFCYLHLGILISKILIRRNYFPFVPLDDTGPKGPQPLPKELCGAPKGWWRENAHLVFDCSRMIATIFDELQKRRKLFCNSYSGYCGLTAASMLIYAHNFPSYDPTFHDADLYYQYCVNFLKFYKARWELGSYYYDFLQQTRRMLEAAANNKIEIASISAFEHMKDELIEVANVAAPLPKTDRLNIENLLRSPKMPNSPAEDVDWLSTNMAWDFGWSNLGAPFTDYMC
ncbi:hypothetical protein KL924_000027 [Ogataea haglerorum]|nr:hypothetical protein KL924_000027 [Ogataea haglerorum]